MIVWAAWLWREELPSVGARTDYLIVGTPDRKRLRV
jgi:hypothetical protein